MGMKIWILGAYVMIVLGSVNQILHLFMQH